MTFDPMDDQRRRDAEQRVRDAEQRERDRAQREREREKERADREREHEQRREERRARHEARHEFGFRHRGLDINVDVDPDEIARSVSAAFIGMDSDSDTETHDQTIEKTFTVDGMPRLRVQNVSGEIAIRVGESNQVRVVAHKRVKGGSADRAKRLLENVEVRIEQQGNDIFVEPHLYEQERSWLDLFRGKRFRVDFEITVPRETAVNAQTVSGDFDLNGTRGPARVESVSGDVNIADVQGPMRLKSVSGDVDIRGRVRACELHTVSGDISVDLDPEAGGRESRLKTISGDVEVGLLSSSCYCDYHTASGDLECDEPARIIREGRKDRTIIIGDGRSHLSVKTVSGDLTIKAASSSVREEPAAAEDSPEAEAEAGSEKESGRDPERTAPMAPPTTAKVHDLLERLARGEVSVDEVAAKLDESRRGQ
ncbi:MAG: DUF4097 domain-containing protein [Chloroflexi bacterium]|nr:MAG: DUF4097 domain-containing protein [Chloroflexota bacterium]